MSLLGYFCGHSWELLHTWLPRGGFIILGCLIILVGFPYLLRRLRKLSPTLLIQTARAQIWLGILTAVLEAVCIAVLVRLAQGDRATVVDQGIADWVNAHPLPALDALAQIGTLPGTLPAAVALSVLMLTVLWFRGRSWREIAAIVWSLLASEGIGLVLLGLFRSRDIEPVNADVWPFGFAGLFPLRAFAVYGMSAVVLSRQSPAWGRVAVLVAAALVILVGFSVVWTQAQQFTETLLEFAAGALIVFAGLWWLEGHGPGLVSPPAGNAKIGR
jgi:hypothetical protein